MGRRGHGDAGGADWRAAVTIAVAAGLLPAFHTGLSTFSRDQPLYWHIATWLLDYCSRYHPEQFALTELRGNFFVICFGRATVAKQRHLPPTRLAAAHRAGPHNSG